MLQFLNNRQAFWQDTKIKAEAAQAELLATAASAKETAKEIITNPKQIIQGAVVGNSVDVVGGIFDAIHGATSAPIEKALGLEKSIPFFGTAHLRTALDLPQQEADSKAAVAGSFISPAGALKATAAFAFKVVGKTQDAVDLTKSTLKTAERISAPADVSSAGRFGPNAHFVVTAERGLPPEVAEKAKFLAEQTSVNNASLFNLTGAFRDIDGHLKTILSTKDSIASSKKLGANLDEVYPNSKLYKTVPELKEVKTGKLSKDDHALGRFSGKEGTRGKLSVREDTNLAEVTDIIMHESQHAIQRLFGFSSGSQVKSFLDFNPKTFQQKITDARKSPDKSVRDAAERFKDAANLKLRQAEVKYLNTPGEQEARFVQETSDMNAVQLGTYMLEILKKGMTPSTHDTRPLPTKKK